MYIYIYIHTHILYIYIYIYIILYIISFKEIAIDSLTCLINFHPLAKLLNNVWLKSPVACTYTRMCLTKAIIMITDDNDVFSQAAHAGKQ